MKWHSCPLDHHPHSLPSNMSPGLTVTKFKVVNPAKQSTRHSRSFDGQSIRRRLTMSMADRTLLTRSFKAVSDVNPGDRSVTVSGVDESVCCWRLTMAERRNQAAQDAERRVPSACIGQRRHRW